jgi:hypothetical protein
MRFRQPRPLFKVSIPPWFDFALFDIHPAGTRRHVGFNPTLVRFCPAVLRAVELSYRSFQSHLGSILPELAYRSGVPALLVSIPPWFDFALSESPPAAPQDTRFNPTLVRFCLVRSTAERLVTIGFNPTLVRFCRVGEGPAGEFVTVSIPPWFDFAAGIAGRVYVQQTSFNPTLVRFCLSLYPPNC